MKLSPITQKTLADLEYFSVLELISGDCQNDLSRQEVLLMRPLLSKEAILTELLLTQEFLSSIESATHIPAHNFQEVSQEIKLLGIENSLLEASGFIKIKHLSQTANTHILFFKKFESYFPTLFKLSCEIEYNTFIISEVEKIFDKFGEIKNDATPVLSQIRQSIAQTRIKINQSFAYALSECLSADYLDEIRESVVENRRVLAVKAMYRKRVKGAVLGSSKTGSIIYIEPEQTIGHSRELSHLIEDEKEEIRRILKKLTDSLRPFAGLISAYQTYLIKIDTLSAKALFAQKTQSSLPTIKDERTLNIKRAFHPLLLLNNIQKGVETFPQDITLNEQNRIIVISGPNAGGKSITLKTIGLLQLMLQSGMLVPVKEGSEMCLFQKILTDIGDNQSIENHLSTYSYRLKNMNYFLKKINDLSLFLIDEFGTGSDPELGGALAETFLEEFYHRKAFGIITTHYANLKILADELEYTTNANMAFNDKTLQPLYKLIIGEPGSSFTFEVAQKNGIPFSLINRAKKKIDGSKVRFDATIARLQKERFFVEKTSEELKETQEKAISESKRLEELNTKIQNRLSSYQEVIDQNLQYVSIGKKVDELLEKFHQDNNRRPLISNFLKLALSENSKRKEKDQAKEEESLKKQKEAEKQVNKELELIRKKKEKEEQKLQEEMKKEAYKMQKALKVGNRVRIEGSKSIGTIEKIEKSQAIINYGIFTTKVEVSKIELVQ